MFCGKVVSPAITLAVYFFIFPLFGSFSVQTALGFYGCGTRLSVQLHTTAFPANYSFAERKNLQEIHFKPPVQARQQTFASDKTKPVTAGDESGIAVIDANRRGNIIASLQTVRRMI